MANSTLIYHDATAEDVFPYQERMFPPTSLVLRKVVTGTGMALLVFSVFMPWVNSPLGGSSLLNLYGQLGGLLQSPSSEFTLEVMMAILLTLIMYPVAIAHGLISLLTRDTYNKTTILSAGTIALLSAAVWIYSIESLGSVVPFVTPLAQTGMGTYVAVIGALTTLTSYFVKERQRYLGQT